MIKALTSRCIDRPSLSIAEISAREDQEYFEKRCEIHGELLCGDGCPQCDQDKLEEIRSGTWFETACTIMLLCLPAFGQAAGSGPWLYSGPAAYGAWAGAAPTFFAALPLNYVDNTLCNPLGQVYDTTIVLGTSTNNGPNVSSVALGGVYPATYLGLLDAMNNWRDNGANTYGGSGYSDKWWLVLVPGGSVITSSTYDANNAIISLPGKLATLGGAEPSKCLVVDSTTPLPSHTVTGTASGTLAIGHQMKQNTTGAQATLMNVATSLMWLGPIYGYPDPINLYAWVDQTSGGVFTPTGAPVKYMPCSGGLPGFGGARNPGCASNNPLTGLNDLAHLWNVQHSVTQTVAGNEAIYAGKDLAHPTTNWANHVVLRNVEASVAGGIAPGANGVKAVRLIDYDSNPLNAVPCIGCQAVTHIGLENYYLRGNDPGDSGQPSSGTGYNIDSSGNCLAWYNSGTIAVTNTGATATVLWTSTASMLGYGNTYFGPTFLAGSQLNLGGSMSGTPPSLSGGANYTINAFDPTASNTSLTINTAGGLPTSGTYTYIQINPPSQYTPGCGDDVENGVIFNVDNGWREGGYIEKIHWANSESHSSLQGFSNGPYKEAYNWEEGGSSAWFSGGAPVDIQGGPATDAEIRHNYFGRDLNYRFLTGNAGTSPSPPWGCGTFDGTASHNTCPYCWGIKNSMELKIGHRVLIAGNIIENSWADGQQGWAMLITARTISGGSAAGIFDPSTGLPRTTIDNIRFESNWLRNAPMPIQFSNRSGSPTNGGGVSMPVQNNDFLNNLFSNIADTNQWSHPGKDWQWTSGQDIFTCSMSYTGSGPYTVTAACLPWQSDITGGISNIAVTQLTGTACTQYSGVASPCQQVKLTTTATSRWDPILCTGLVPSACIASGQTTVVSGVSGYSGTFAMTGTDGNWASDGTGGNNIYYIDTINSPSAGVKCSGTSTCATLLGSGAITFASLGYKMTGITPPTDAVYAYNVGGGDTSCTADGYAVGAASSTYAAAGTIATGLTVVYQVATAPNTSVVNPKCLINNGAGFPKNMTLQNNTFLATNAFNITIAAQFWQPVNNYFLNNVFADNDSAKASDFVCTPIGGGEGSPSYPCMDANTFEFYGNVLTGRNSSDWNSGTKVDPLTKCSGGACGNIFPALSGSYPTGSCGGSTGEGQAAVAPFNCPLMALPWASNFSLSNLSTMGGSYTAQGVNPAQLNQAMTQTEYVCPAGANCGTHGPYPD